MKKKIIMGLFVLTAVIGMGFAGNVYYNCGRHIKSTTKSNSNRISSEKCPQCEQDSEDATTYRKGRDEYCTRDKKQQTVDMYNFFKCDQYNNTSDNN